MDDMSDSTLECYSQCVLDESIFLQEKEPEHQNQIVASAPIYTCSKADVVQRLNAIDWSFSTGHTAYLSHDIHPYPAKFIPQLPAQIIHLLSSVGETVWDPFGGCGTSALEALLSDRNCISTDLNPIASIIGKAKTTVLCPADEQELTQFIAKLEYYSLNESCLSEYIRSHRQEFASEIPEIPNIQKWFTPTAIDELAFIKYLFKRELRTDAAINIAKVSLSKAVSRVSNQESETTYRAVQKDIHLGDASRAFLRDIKANIAKIKALSSQIGYRSCQFITANVMEPVVGKDLPIQAGEADLIVTSPPYPNAFDYHLYHRFRIFWLDEDPRTMGKAEIGSHLNYQRGKKTFQQFEDEMAPVLKNCFKALKTGRYAVFVLGNAVFNGVEYQTAERIGALAETIGFQNIAIINRHLPANKRSIKAWARRATEEQLLVLKKPGGPSRVTLLPVKYRLYGYEKTISGLERAALTGADSDTLHVDPYRINHLKKLTFYEAFQYEDSTFKTWQSILERSGCQSGTEKKDPKYLTHGIHPYKGKFYPQLVRPLLNILGIPEGGTVLDPFCGSGTVALESVLNGYHAFGCDINPIAVEIAAAKSSIFKIPAYEFETHITFFRQSLSQYQERDYSGVFPAGAIAEIQSWFPEKAVNKMGFILTKISEIPDERIRCFLRVILSSIIREISQQEPSDLRIRRRKEPIQDAPVLELYTENLLRQYRNIMAFYKVQNLAPNPIGDASIWRGSLTQPDGRLGAESVDIVITSPPYATALPYIDTNRLNMLVLDGINAAMRVPIEAQMTGTREIKKTTRAHFEGKIERREFGSIRSPSAKELICKIYRQNNGADVGFRRKNMAALLYMYFRDMSDVMNTLDHVVKHAGYICIVIGDTKTTTAQETVVIQTTEVLRETAELLGWASVQDIPISVTVERYVHMGNSITENSILIFQKP